MTIYSCSTCGSFHDSAKDLPCPSSVINIALPSQRIAICSRCGDIPLQEGLCPACSQQVTYPFTDWDGSKHIPAPGPLCVLRRGRRIACAVVDETALYGHPREWLTACGEVINAGSVSVWSHPPTCGACRRGLRANIAPTQLLTKAVNL